MAASGDAPLRRAENETEPEPVHVLYLIGYDAGAKQFVATGFDDLGGASARLRAGGTATS
jgi:hypothetical protein